MKMDDIIKKELDEEMKKIQVPSSLYDFAKNIKEESESKERPVLKKRGKRKFQFAAAAVIGLGVLTGSAFLNPAVAEMASKIPYLGQVFKTKSLDVLLWEALEKEGYERFSLGMRPGETVLFEVRVEGSEKDAERERENITRVVDNVLKSKGYDSYKIHVSSFMPEYTPLTEDEEKMGKLGEKVEKALKNTGYEIQFVNPFNEVIEITIPLTETRGEEIKIATLEIVRADGSDKDVLITSVDVEKNKREDTWTDYLRSIHEGLALKKEYKVSGYGYQYKKNKMNIFIKTSMKASDDEAKETVEKIRKEITTFIESEKEKSVVKNDDYEIIVRDRTGKDFPF
jgi:hypothetical protein